MAEVMGPDMPSWQLRAFWRSYWASGDRDFGMMEFSRLVRMGHLLCIWLLEKDRMGGDLAQWMVSGQFGVELMHDFDGPYTQFVFFDRDVRDPTRGDLWDVLPCVVMTAWQITQMYSEAEGFGGEQRLFLGGRKGWRRVVKALGIEMREGWISNRQEVFGHGNVRRH